MTPGRDPIFWAFIEGLTMGFIVGAYAAVGFLWWAL